MSNKYYLLTYYTWVGMAGDPLDSAVDLLSSRENENNIDASGWNLFANFFP